MQQDGQTGIANVLRLRPRTLGFSYFLELFVQFRWAAAFCAGLTIFITQFYFGFESFAFTWLYFIVGLIFLYNAVFFIYLRRRVRVSDNVVHDSSRSRQSRLVALSQILLDLIALFWLLHFAGGLTNPFVLFFLFHVVVAGTLLEPRSALGVAFFAAALVFALGILEKTGVLAHYRSVEIFGDTNPIQSWLFALGFPAVLTATILGLSVLVLAIMNERTRQRDKVIELSEALDAKNRELIRVDEMRKQLLTVASHDLKSPIAAVSGYLMGLRDGYLGTVTDEQRQVLDRSLARLGRLKEFINDVLDWTAIERGVLRQDMRMTNIGDILLRVVEDHRYAALDRLIDVELSLPKDLPIVECAPERMAQVFDNLVSNAVKYSKEGGLVRVEARKKDDDVIITFLDRGIGISREDLENLFKDFFRAPSVKRKVEGTGLGLALVRRIVTAHQGEIWATSELGHGSAFFIRLPIRQTTESANQAQPLS